jgi:uncharacterized protein YbjT (DUF2867 family)
MYLRVSAMVRLAGSVLNDSMNDDTTNATLVLGATGKTGRRVADRLRADGRPVRIGSRAAHPGFDWVDRSTWGAALSGIGSAYVAYQPDLAEARALETIQAFFDQAVASGVRKLVLLSGRGEVEAEKAEQSLRAMDVDWTILRASWFSQNFSENYWLEPIIAGQFALPVGQVAEPFVDVEDIADIAFTALTCPGHAGQLYELTGPRALTFAEAVDEIARATGRDIQFSTVTPDAYRDELVKAQLPSDVIDLVLYLLTTVLDGRNTPVGDGVQRALGRAPRAFSDYVRLTAATGVWAAT